MNLDDSEEWVPKNMAFDNSDVKSMNLSLIILSLRHGDTDSSNNGGFWEALNNGSVVLVYGLLVVLVCGLSVIVVARGALIGGLTEMSHNLSAELVTVPVVVGDCISGEAALPQVCHEVAMTLLK